MKLIPEEKLQSQITFNLTPMIDFLFLMLAFFATMAISRASLYDTQLDLAHLKSDKNSQAIFDREENCQINLGISKEGQYKWLSKDREYPLDNLERVQKELTMQRDRGFLPHDKTKTEILLHIDKHAPWEPVAKLIFHVREMGFEPRPVYEPESLSTDSP